MVKIGIANQKGGVGKSFMSVNIATCLASKGNKVLFIDCDASCNSTEYLGFNKEQVSATIADCLAGEKRLTDEGVLRPATITKSFFGFDKEVSIGVDVLAGDLRVENMEFDDLQIVKDLISDVESTYDYCIFDCPSQKTSLTLVSLIACDHIIVPINPSIDSIKGYMLMTDLIQTLRSTGEGREVGLLGVAMNKYKGNRQLDRYITEEVLSGIPQDKIFKTFVRESSLAEQARFMSKPLIYFKSTHPITRDMMDLTDEILEKLRKKG